MICFALFIRFLFSCKNKRNERKQKLIEINIKLSEIASQFEEKLLQQEIRLGTPSHDIWFPIVNQSRYLTKYFYITCWLKNILSKKYRQRADKLIEIMNDDLKNMSPDMQNLIKEYKSTLFEAFMIRHRIIFKIMLLHTIIANWSLIVDSIKENKKVQPISEINNQVVNMQFLAA